LTCLVNYPFFRVVNIPIERQADLADRGAIMEFCAYAVQSTDGHSVERVAEAVERIGPENCLLATDFGQADNPSVDGLAAFYEGIVEGGIDEGTAEQLSHVDAREGAGNGVTEECQDDEGGGPATVRNSVTRTPG